MNFVNYTFSYHCDTNFSEEERSVQYKTFRDLQLPEQRKQYIVNNVSKVRLTTSGRKKHSWVYTFVKTDGEKVQVCRCVYMNTLQVKEKILRYTLKNSGLGFSKPDQRGRHTPPHKLNTVRKNHVISHLKSFPIVPSHYARKRSKWTFIEDTSNY